MDLPFHFYSCQMIQLYHTANAKTVSICRLLTDNFNYVIQLAIKCHAFLFEKNGGHIAIPSHLRYGSRTDPAIATRSLFTNPGQSAASITAYCKPSLPFNQPFSFQRDNLFIQENMLTDLPIVMVMPKEPLVILCFLEDSFQKVGQTVIPIKAPTQNIDNAVRPAMGDDVIDLPFVCIQGLRVSSYSKSEGISSFHQK